jgi:hypothetical protein
LKEDGAFISAGLKHPGHGGATDISRKRDIYEKERDRGRANSSLDLGCSTPWNTRSRRRLLRESQVTTMLLKRGASRGQKRKWVKASDAIKVDSFVRKSINVAA